MAACFHHQCSFLPTLNVKCHPPDSWEFRRQQLPHHSLDYRDPSDSHPTIQPLQQDQLPQHSLFLHRRMTQVYHAKTSPALHFLHHYSLTHHTIPNQFFDISNVNSLSVFNPNLRFKTGNNLCAEDYLCVLYFSTKKASKEFSQIKITRLYKLKDFERKTFNLKKYNSYCDCSIQKIHDFNLFYGYGSFSKHSFSENSFSEKVFKKLKMKNRNFKIRKSEDSFERKHLPVDSEKFRKKSFSPCEMDFFQFNPTSTNEMQPSENAKILQKVGESAHLKPQKTSDFELSKPSSSFSLDHFIDQKEKRMIEITKLRV